MRACYYGYKCVQVLRLYEVKVLDSIQFLFDLGFVPRVVLPYRAPLDRAAVVEAVRCQMEGAGTGVPLALESWPRGATAAAADAMEGSTTAMTGLDEGQGATALGMRILSTSRWVSCVPHLPREFCHAYFNVLNAVIRVDGSGPLKNPCAKLCFLRVDWLALSYSFSGVV